MDSTNDQFWNYLLNVLQVTTIHLLILFGPLILLSTLMHFISKKNEKISIDLLGRNTYLFLFAWLGVSTHELGHAFFAIIFGHRINHIKLFSPNPHEGSLGYVDHSYNSKNIYHQIGNFFIGIGPILFNALLLFLITLLLFDVNVLNFYPSEMMDISFSRNSSIQTIFNVLWSSLLNFFQAIWTSEKSTWWKLIIMGYALYAIGGAISLSRADIVSAWKGLFLIILIVFIFNMATYWLADFTESLILHTIDFISAFCFIIILSMLINLCFLAIIAILQAIKSTLMK